VVALSGPVDQRRLEAGLGVLRRAGHRPIVAPNVGRDSEWGYLAGSDSARLAGLERVLDEGARTVLAARGGFGVARLLRHLPWERLVSERVTFVGFSDLTALLNRLPVAGGCVQVHGPMAAAGLQRSENAGRLLRLLRGDLVGRDLFRFGPKAIVRPGSARGFAAGGNLTVLTSLIGTRHEPRWDGAVLFLEEVNEPLYRLDRMLTHLAGSGRLTRVKALIGGSLRGCRPARERDLRWRELLAEVAPVGAPVVVGRPFGHGAANLAFPIGAQLDVDTAAGTVVWSS